MSPVIRVENLSKRYVIQHNARRNPADGGFRHLIEAGVHSAVSRITRPFSRSSQNKSVATSEEFWALKDVSFEVNQGECVGIIGRNGAGKSTLLKILSRITEPTSGYARLRGRVGCLLEVGTGFHPELTGRENIYLNGAILGMKRVEVARKFDEIVAFAEVEKFIDTPVKHYSSGMYMRLAFSVAAHLEPEILIVDEVLAVGDAEFQKKCLGKMGDVTREGRTVLFVSHNMAAVQNLCSSCIYLQQGRVEHHGDIAIATAQYLGSQRSQHAHLTRMFPIDSGKPAYISEAWIESNGEKCNCILPNHCVDIVLIATVTSNTSFVAELLLRQQNGVPVSFSSSGLIDQVKVRGTPGVYKIRCRLPDWKMAAGQYSVDTMLSVLNDKYIDQVESALTFNIDSSSIGEQAWNYQQSEARGCIYWDVGYTVERVS